MTGVLLLLDGMSVGDHLRQEEGDHRRPGDDHHRPEDVHLRREEGDLRRPGDDHRRLGGDDRRLI